MKPLSEMTLEELWQLFPIELAPHRPEWAAWAREEIDSLRQLLRGDAARIHHIGSTAVPGIMAKPIVDILVEIAPGDRLDAAGRVLEQGGYICMSRSPGRMSFNKGYTPAGYAARVFHIHLRRAGDCDELLFRDYLRAHPETAREYERLKLGLLPALRHNRDGYTAAKTLFVRRVTSLAKQEKEHPD